MPLNVAPTPHFVRGLDSFRFIAAAIVAASHGGWVPFDKFAGETHGVWQLLAGAWNSLPNGTLAVCVFFFISGFCIHFPNVAKEHVPIVLFLIKRGLRIGIPMFVILATAYASGRQYVSALDGVLWSVYCELAYYALYPVLYPILRGRWVRATIISTAVSIGLLIVFPETPRPAKFGMLTFVFCAPMWLLGAVLAERYRSGTLFNDRLPPAWPLRAALPISAILATFLFYHAPIKVPQTWAVVAFVPLGYVWLAKELQRLTSHTTNDRLEALGRAAYSIYLVHQFPLTLFHDHFQSWPAAAFYPAQAVMIGLSAWAFYVAIERPSHGLSKAIGRR